MRFARLAWSLPAFLLVLSGAAHAQETLVPDGEGVEVLDGAQWAPLVGVRGLAVTPDGMTIASVSEDGVLRLWDAPSGAELRRFPAVPAGQTAVAISADGKVVAAAGRDGSLQIWDVAHGRNLQARDPDGTPISSLALSPDGRFVAFGGPRRTPSLWRYLDDHDAIPVDAVADSRGLAFGRQGSATVLAVTQANHTVTLVDPATRKVKKTLTVAAGALGPVAFSLDGHALAAGADTGVVAVWDLASGHSRLLEASSEPITSVRFATIGVGAGELLLTTALDGGVRVWSGATLELVRKLAADEPCCLSVGAAAPREIVAAGPRGIVRWDVASGRVLPTLAGESPAVLGLATAGQGGESIAVVSADGRARVIAGDTGKVVREVAGVAGGAVALSPDERTLAYADSDNVVHLFDVPSGKDSGNTGPLEGTVNALAFSSDGAQLAGAVSGNGIQIWDPASGRRLFALDGHREDVAVAYAVNGHKLISARGASFTLWSGDQGTLLRRIGVDSTVTAVALSADGAHAAAGLDDGSIHVYTDDGTEEALLLGHGPGMLHLALSADGKTLVSASHDGTVGIWDVAAKNERSTLEGHVGGATALALSSDGSLAIAGTGDGAVRLWSVADGTSKGLLRYAPDGWLALLNGKVVRSETGRFLLHATDAGELANRPPTVEGTPKLTASIASVKPVGEGENVGEITLRIQNAAGAARAFWITAVLPRDKAGRPLPSDIALVSPQILPRLDAGASATLTLPISYLPSLAPGPQELKLALQLVDAAGKGPSVTVPVHVASAQLRAQLVTMEGPRNAPVARIEVTNDGDEASGPLTVVPSFVDRGQTVATLPVIQLPGLAPKEHTSLGVAGPASAMRSGAQLHLAISGSIWPTYAWTFSVPLRRALPWSAIFGVLVALLLILAALYVMRVSRHPIVLAVSRDPNELRRFALSDLATVQGALVRARRLRGALAAAKVPEVRWRRAVQASSSPEAAATAFAEALGAVRTPAAIGGQAAWALQLPELQLRFPRETVVLVATGAQIDAAQAALIGTALHKDDDGPTVVIALDLTASQTAASVLQAMPRMSFVVLSTAQVRDLLLHEEPLVALQAAVVAQRPLSELSPYQGSGGLDAEQLFFGRDRELRAMTDRVQRSFLVVAPRQMGKSTLLKAVHRRLVGRQDVEAHLITMSDDDLSARVARQLNRPKADTSEGFLELAAGTRRKPRVWLIDEADAFIHRDARNRYPISQAMRTLSEEGRAFFILSGFWHLYAAAYLSSNNPLRNFGEVVRLEPLDRQAARDLVTKPMAALGLTYENPELVEKLLDETACRAHLLVAICRGMVDRLGPADRVLTEANVHQGLYQNPTLTDEFKYWRREPLGRALVRLVMLYGPMVRAVLRETLTQQGLDVANELFQSTLDRLDLGYILVSGDDGKLFCPVPLLRRYIEQEDSLESGLRRDIDDFLGIQTEGGPMPMGTMPGIPPVSAA